jgi:hypothetical protein
MKPVLIIGCGRSGTKFTAEMLRSAELFFGHERIEANGGIGWPLALPSYRRAWPERAIIWHQVRAPLPTIGSLTTHTDSVWRAVSKAIPVPVEMDPVQRAALYYLEYNRYCAELAEWTYRVEDLATNGTQTRQRFEVHFGRSFTCPPSDTNSRLHTEIKWADINEPLRTEVTELARSYGYEVQP